ncbi:putative RNA polymerase sigma factor [Patulibacter medicamentivorans]|uniref:Putative RNA polymerase sigma factor n=1 Tax=Patulibacter medicamentivorans TaxID=1097667 RepID=H0E0C6_9ACTN|nr:sigma-70 family RNA polymerase sigma factor [Patulibacter medicamentivorans]EHN12929.1 putative RNA polymerase sigma factor [Patulibacter medicamentivorans]
MTEQQRLSEEFEQHRGHLRGVAYRMLGSLSDADDAVQEAWLRLHRSEVDEVENLRAWLTTVVARLSLDMLRSRERRGEEPLELRLPEPIVDAPDGTHPEHEALIADSVGLALLVVLSTLSPAERIAFVLHDLFAIPFDEIGRVVDRSPDAARELASRARRRVRSAPTEPDADLATQREVTAAFRAAARDGDLAALVGLLDPDVVLRADLGASGGVQVIRGAETVARQASDYQRRDLDIRPALINGVVGVVTLQDGRPSAVGAYTIRGRRIVAIDILADPGRLARLDIARLAR